VLSAQNEDETLYYLQDDLGSPIRLMNEHGMRREVLGYDEFGGSLYRSFRNQPFTFTGYQLDTVTNTYFAQAREYSPFVGRFISQDTHWNPSNMIYGDELQALKGVSLIPDPLAIGQSHHLYTYTLGNPLNYLDLNGESS